MNLHLGEAYSSCEKNESIQKMTEAILHQPSQVTSSTKTSSKSKDSAPEYSLSDKTLGQVKQVVHMGCEDIQKVFLSEGLHPRLVLNALIARGHILLEGVPGVAKTTLASAVARVLGCPMKRVQFTPDLLPTDILGGSVFNPQTGQFKIIKGPIFSNILLADEINRAPAKTQSALLEAMQEGQVTLDGVSEALPQPFFTIATQNPTEHFGVYPLPEAQLDRFALRVFVDYPSAHIELSMIMAYQGQAPVCQPRMTPKLISQLQQLADKVFIHPELIKYIVSLARWTRGHPHIKLGISPRACLTLTKLCKARALMEGRPYVTPMDIQELLIHCWSHRLQLSDEALYAGVNTKSLMGSCLKSTAYHGPNSSQLNPAKPNTLTP